jgi:flagellin
MSLGNIGADQIGARQLDLNAADSAADGGLGQSVGDASLTVPVGNKVAGNLDINGLTPVQITTSTDDSAKDVAQKINNERSATGVSATAQTGVKIDTSTLSNAGTLSFSLNGTTVSANATATDMSSMAAAINDKSATTGVSASIDDAGDLLLSDADGNDITITAVSVNGGTDGGTFEAFALDSSGTQEATGLTLEDDTSADGLAGGSSGSGTFAGTVTLSSDATFSATSSNALLAANTTTTSSTLINVDTVDLSTVSGSQDALAIIDSALAQIDNSRASLGAVQNRFSQTISNLANIQENVSASRSRIQDTDFAVETAQMTKNQILQQAGTSILAQANQLPQAALSLIG